MKTSILLCLVLLAACGSGADEGSAADPPDQPAVEKGATFPGDTALEGTPRAGAVQAVQRRADQAEADMAERARQAEEQVRQAEGGAQRP